MSVPRWALALLRRLAPPAGAEDVLGDLEEAHRARVKRRGRLVASFLTGMEALDMACALIVERVRRRRTGGESAPSRQAAVKIRRARLGVSMLDIKLGFRMLAKYPGLTLVGGLAIAFAIWTGAISFEFYTQMVRPKLPLDGGDRIVGIMMLDPAAANVRDPTLHDFVAWREALESVEDLGAFRRLGLNSIVGNGAGEPVEVAEISASAFHMARVPPLLGRTLVEEDEQAGAPEVVVIGYEVWRRRFDSDPGVIGRELRLGNVRHTIVGVMPEGFRFPVAHDFWVPFRLRALDYEPGQGPAVKVFGRLAPGAALETAQAELAVLGASAASAYPDTHQLLRPRVMPYAPSVFGSVFGMLSLRLTSLNLLVVMLLFLVCGNVALLMFARAATRENEIVVRSALGASSRRIIGQLFVEALVLATVAGAVGLIAAQLTWRRMFEVVAKEAWSDGAVPFWFHSDLSSVTVPYAALLALLAAAIAGFLPGRKVTRGLATRLRQAGPGGSGFRFGGIWTVLIVAQVAVMAAVPVFLFIIQGEVWQKRALDLGFPTEEYLSATLTVDQERIPSADSAQIAALAAAYPELERRLEAEPGVTAVTFADRLPLMWHPFYRIEVDEGGASESEAAVDRGVRAANVAPDFFDALDAPILLGRGFHSGDLPPNARSVVVNQSFVKLVLGGSNPIGRRLRYLPFVWSGSEWTSTMEEPDETTSADAPWYEIVGIVRDMGMHFRPESMSGIYHLLAPGESYPVRIAVHTRGDPLLLVSRLRSIATDVDPTLQLHDISALDEVTAQDLRIYTAFFWITVAITSVVSLLSLTGIYAVVSFTASQRVREVGIRVALGGRPRQVAAAIFRRPLAQVGLGILLGLALAVQISTIEHAYVVAMYGWIIIVICALAALMPVRRALRVQPTEALKADA